MAARFRFRWMPVEPIAFTTFALAVLVVVLVGSMAMEENPLKPIISTTLLIAASTFLCIFFALFSTGHSTWSFAPLDLLISYFVLDPLMLAATALLLPRDESRKMIDHLLTATPVPVYPELSLSPLQQNGAFASSLIGVITAAIVVSMEDVRRKRLCTIAFAFNMCAGVTVLPSAVYSVHGYETAATFLREVVIYVVLWRALFFAGTMLVCAAIWGRRRDGAASGKPGQEREGGGAGPASSALSSRTIPHPLLSVLQSLPVAIAFPLVPMDAHVSQAEPQAGPQADPQAEPASLHSIEPATPREASLRDTASEGGSRRSSRSSDGSSDESGWVSTSPSHSSEGDAAFLAEHEGDVFGEEDGKCSISTSSQEAPQEVEEEE
jgi:hypothetical protein